MNQGTDDDIVFLVKTTTRPCQLQSWFHVPPQTPIEDLVMILFSWDENEGPAPELSHLLERSPAL